MDNLNILGSAKWIGIVSNLFIVLCFYFTLTFLQHLKADNKDQTEESKKGAVLCFAIALLVPVIYNIYISYQMMK